MSLVRLSRTSASEPDVPGDSTLVLSQMIASTPLLAQRLQCRLVGPLADQRRRVELPVAGVQQPAERRLEDQCVGIGDRVGDVDEPALEAADAELLARLDDPDRHIAGEVGLAQLRAQHGGGERRCTRSGSRSRGHR